MASIEIETEKKSEKKMLTYFTRRRARFFFFMRLRCHFQRICLFFFQRRELLFIELRDALVYL